MLLTIRKTLLSDFDYFENLLKGLDSKILDNQGFNIYIKEKIKEHLKNNKSVNPDIFINKECSFFEEDPDLKTFKFICKDECYDSNNYQPFCFVLSSRGSDSWRIHEISYQKKDYRLTLSMNVFCSMVSVYFQELNSYAREMFEFGASSAVHVSSAIPENLKQQLKSNTEKENFKVINQILGIETRTQEEKELELLNNDYKLEDMACCGTLIKAEEVFSSKKTICNKVKIS